jgi:predicted dehydrogenase
MNNSDDQILKCGIVGYGYMGEIRKKVIENSPRLELLGIVETDKNKSEKIKDCRVFKTYEELIDQNIDIMFVCTPNVYSPGICIKSMERGIHVFCEKPPGRNVFDIKKIIDAEKSNKSVKLMFGFNHRFHPAVLKAKAIVDSGRLGEIICLRAIYGKSGGKNFNSSWRNNKDISGGGILLDQGIHMLDLFRLYCGDFTEVKCFLNNSHWNFDVEDNAYVILGNDKKQNAFFHSSATLWKHTFEINILLKNGYLRVEGLLSKSGSYGREKLTIGKKQFEDEATAVGNPAEEIMYFDRDLSWDLEVEALVSCINEDKEVTMSSSQDALRVMEIIERAYIDAGMETYAKTN